MTPTRSWAAESLSGAETELRRVERAFRHREHGEAEEGTEIETTDAHSWALMAGIRNGLTAENAWIAEGSAFRHSGH